MLMKKRDEGHDDGCLQTFVLLKRSRIKGRQTLSVYQVFSIFPTAEASRKGNFLIFGKDYLPLMFPNEVRTEIFDVAQVHYNG